MVDKINNTMTEDELVAILRAAAEAEPENEPNTITRHEYMTALDVTEYTARKQLAELCDDGVLKRAWVARVDGWDTRQRIRGYRYVGGS